MSGNILESASQIGVTEAAEDTLGKIYVSCPITSSNFGRFKSIKTLADLDNIARLSMISLVNIAQESGKEQIDADDIARLFGGKIHLENLELRASGEGLISTGKSYRERLEKLEISVLTKENEAEFAVIDMLVDGIVGDIRGERAIVTSTVAGENVVFENIYLAGDERVGIGSTVLVHYGMVIGLVGEDVNLDVIGKNREDQEKNSYFQEQASNLVGTIDCEQICADKSRDMTGFDIAQWARPRLR